VSWNAERREDEKGRRRADSHAATNRFRSRDLRVRGLTVTGRGYRHSATGDVAEWLKAAVC